MTAKCDDVCEAPAPVPRASVCCLHPQSLPCNPSNCFLVQTHPPTQSHHCLLLGLQGQLPPLITGARAQVSVCGFPATHTCAHPFWVSITLL